MCKPMVRPNKRHFHHHQIRPSLSLCSKNTLTPLPLLRLLLLLCGFAALQDSVLVVAQPSSGPYPCGLPNERIIGPPATPGQALTPQGREAPVLSDQQSHRQQWETVTGRSKELQTDLAGSGKGGSNCSLESTP